MSGITDGLFLSTRIKIPTPRRGYVVRESLFADLQKCDDFSVIYVCGGAGTGKSTLIASFLRENSFPHVGWLSLDDTNANLYSFWHYFAAAAGAMLGDPEFPDLLLSLVETSSIEQILMLISNRLCSDETYLLVVDDLHVIRDESLLHSLQSFIRIMPDNLHLFLLSREKPPFYLGDLAVAGRLLLIGNDRLTLREDESREFLSKTLGLSLSPERISHLTDFAEGWIGGLQLAVAADAFIDGRRGTERAGRVTAEYLTREVFLSLREEERTFLLLTSPFSYFDAAVADAVGATGECGEFRPIIESLTAKNLFLICIDEERGQYRYHNILSAYLSERFNELSTERRTEILLSGAAVYERIGEPAEAIRNFSKAGSHADVMRIAANMRGDVEAWPFLDEVPCDILIEDPDLSAQSFLYNLGNLRVERCTEIFEQFRLRFEGTDTFRAIEFASAYLSKSQGGVPNYHLFSPERIEALPFGSVIRAMILVENANALTERMRYDEAIACIDRAVRVSHGSNVFVEFYARGELAQIYEETGRFNDSLRCYDETLELLSSPTILAASGINFYVGMVGVYLRRMDIERSLSILLDAQALMDKNKRSPDVLRMTMDYHWAEYEFLRGNESEGAEIALRIMREFPDFSTVALSRLIYELDCTDRLPEHLAVRFLSEIKEAGDYGKQPFYRLLRARILARRGFLPEALRETEEVLVFARTHGNRLRLVEAGTLKIFLLSLTEPSAATKRMMSNLLREALFYAAENRIGMPFYMERKAIQPVFLAWVDALPDKDIFTTPEMTYLRELWELLDVPGPMPRFGASRRAGSDPPGDFLSGRESEVLTQLARGLSNREIAEELHISVATVKTHVLNIFGKLGVSSRLLAVEEARKRGLLLREKE